jgi:hypothetical protein
MKRLISATLAVLLLGSSVAMAQDYRGYAPDHRAYSRSEYRGRDSNPMAAIGVGLTALGVFAAIASNHDYHPAYYNGGYYARDHGYAGYDMNRGYQYGGYRR